MRATVAALSCALVLFAGACKSSSSSSPTVQVSPAGPVEATGSVLFTATVSGASGDVTWTLSGAGTLSGTTGRTVVYHPPPIGASGDATLTASAAGASASVLMHLGPARRAVITIPTLTAPVTVLTDAWDIPHVQCAATVDCLAVQGWLHARDRLFQMDFLRRVATGHLAELVGVLGLSQDVQLRNIMLTRDGRAIGVALASALDADTAAKVGAYVTGINAYLAALRSGGGALPGEYAQLPYPITAADIPDWTSADVLTFARLQQYLLSETLSAEIDYGRFAATYGPGAPLQSLGKLDVYVRAAAPASEQTHTLTNQSPTPFSAGTATALAAPAPASTAGWAASLAAAGAKLDVLRAALKPLDGTVGSNNWVVDAAHSSTGAAMVANDPHLSLQYPPNFYLATLTSSNPADGLDLTGGAFPGTPGAQVGRGKHVGWGVTVVGYDVTDVYLEQAGPCPAGVSATIPFCVFFNGAFVPVLPVPQTYRVRVGAGAAGLVDASTLPAGQRPPAAAVIVPHHGPLVQAPDAGGHAVSMRWTGQEGWTRDLKAFLGLNTAATAADGVAALADWATGAQNFVLADDAGNIAYYPHALVPVRSFADARVTAPASLVPPWFPLPGGGTAEWGTGVAADHCDGLDHSSFPPTPVTPAAACWTPDAELPQGGSGTANPTPAGYQGFFITANADPLGVSDGNSPLAHPPYLSFDWDDSTGFRHARITERLQALTAGGGKISLADMESVQLDHVSRIGAVFQRHIAAMPALGGADSRAATFDAAKALLAAWKADGFACPSGLLGTDPVASLPDTSGTVPTDSAACYLFHAFLRSLLDRVFADDLAVAGLGVGGIQAVKGMIYMLENPTTADQSFCDDVNATGTVTATHTCDAQVVAALVGAFETLAAGHGLPGAGGWLWGRVHTMQPVSQFPLVTNGYAPGPYARPGGAYTVDVGNPSLSAGAVDFAFTSSGNVRHISVMDPAIPVVKMQLPGPERDVPAGQIDGPDLLGEWAAGRYFDFAHGAQAQAAVVSAQTFTP